MGLHVYVGNRPEGDLEEEIEPWKGRLSEAAGVPIDWNEGADAESFTGKLGSECYGALLLWAACEEHGAERPVTAENWENDSTLRAALGETASKYRHLLGNIEFWLPVDFSEPFLAENLFQEEKVFGSSQRLAAELAALNEATWKAGESEISEWHRKTPEPGSPLEDSARFAFSVFSRLSSLAVQHRLPMKLDARAAGAPTDRTSATQEA